MRRYGKAALQASGRPAANVMALDDDNGATVVIPGSHRWDSRSPTAAKAAAAQPVIMPAGSAMLLLGTLWRGGGANRSSNPWRRQQESFSLSISKAQVRRCSERVPRLLG